MDAWELGRDLRFVSPERRATQAGSAAALERELQGLSLQGAAALPSFNSYLRAVAMQPQFNKVLSSIRESIRRRAYSTPELGSLARAGAPRFVGDVMTRNPRTCRHVETLQQAAQVMWESDCGCVPVVDDSGRAVAMLTDRDVCMAAFTTGLALWQIPLASAASRRIITIGPGDTLEQAESLMRQHRVRRLPVVDLQGGVVGLLSLSDVARRSGTVTFGAPIDGDPVRTTLAAICAPLPRGSA